MGGYIAFFVAAMTYKTGDGQELIGIALIWPLFLVKCILVAFARLITKW